MGSSTGKHRPPSRENSSCSRRYQTDLAFFQHTTVDGFYIWTVNGRNSSFFHYHNRNQRAAAIIKLRTQSIIQLRPKKGAGEPRILEVSMNGFQCQLPACLRLTVFRALAAVKGERYLFGLDPGSSQPNLNQRFDRKLQKWEAVRNFRDPRRMHGVCSFQANLLFVFCGYSGQEGKIQSIQRYDNQRANSGWRKINLEANNCILPRINIQLQYNASQLFIGGTWNDMKTFLVSAGPHASLQVTDEHEWPRLHTRERNWAIIGRSLFYIDYDEPAPPIFFKSHFQEPFDCFYMRDRIYFPAGVRF